MALLSEQLTNQARARAVRSELWLSTGQTAIWHYPAKQASRGNLLLIHGYRGTHHGLEAIVGALEDFDCYVPDLPGFGETSEFDSVHSIENYSNWLTELVKVLNLPKLLVVGHSFGTLVVSKYASENHHCPIVLINPVSSPALSGPRVLLSKLTAAFYGLARVLPNRLGRWLLSHPVAVWSVTQFMYRADEPALKQWIATQHRTYFSRFASTRSAAEGFRASVSCTVRDFAAKITQPTLLICCERDDLTAIENQRQVATMFANAVFVEVPKLGHLIHYEGPSIVAENVRDFHKVTI